MDVLLQIVLGFIGSIVTVIILIAVFYFLSHGIEIAWEKSKIISILAIGLPAALIVLVFWKQILEWFLGLLVLVVFVLVLAGIIIGGLNSSAPKYTVKKTGRDTFEIHEHDNGSD